jgi:flagellar protein FlaG
MDEEINRPVITVRNIETGEVVRQIPSEEIIRMAHSIEEGKGLLFNESL